MHQHNQHVKIRLVGLVTIAMLVGMLAGGRRSHAQSLDDSSARANDSAVTEDPIPPGVESVTTDTPDAPAVPDDAITTNSVDDSAAHPLSDSPDGKYARPGNAVGSDEASGSGSENGAVLELPQVLNLASDGTADRSADRAWASTDGNDEDTAQSSEDEQDLAGDHDLGATTGQVGTLEDYKDQANEAPPGTIFFAPVGTVVGFPRPPLFNPVPRPRFGVPTSPIILPPTSSGPFPSTSPMLMAPRFATFGSFRGRGLMGAHR